MNRRFPQIQPIPQMKICAILIICVSLRFRAASSEPQIPTDSADFTDENPGNPHNLRQSAVQILSRESL